MARKAYTREFKLPSTLLADARGYWSSGSGDTRGSVGHRAGRGAANRAVPSRGDPAHGSDIDTTSGRGRKTRQKLDFRRAEALGPPPTLLRRYRLNTKHCTFLPFFAARHSRRP
jgi:hypothetical protein